MVFLHQPAARGPHRHYVITLLTSTEAYQARPRNLERTFIIIRSSGLQFSTCLACMLYLGSSMGRPDQTMEQRLSNRYLSPLDLLKHCFRHHRKAPGRTCHGPFEVGETARSMG